MTIAQNPMFPEVGRGEVYFDRAMAPAIPGNKGPLRFEEGIATDTDVPNDFTVGAYMDTAPTSRRAHLPNPESQFKHAEQVMQERAHVGSASWVEAPVVLNDFVTGAMAGDGMPTFELEINDGSYVKRPNPTVVFD